MNEPEGRWIATDALAFVEDPADLFDELLLRGIREDPVGEARGAADRALRAATHEHRDTRRWPGPDGERRQVEDVAPVGERLAAPGLREDPEDLVHRRASAARVRPEPREFDLRPPEPEA